MLNNLEPWQLLVWILGLELISAPIIIFCANAISIGWYKAKEQYQIKSIARLGKIMEMFGKKLGESKETSLAKMKEAVDNVDEADS